MRNALAPADAGHNMDTGHMTGHGMDTGHTTGHGMDRRPDMAWTRPTAAATATARTPRPHG